MNQDDRTTKHRVGDRRSSKSSQATLSKAARTPGRTTLVNSEQGLEPQPSQLDGLWRELQAIEEIALPAYLGAIERAAMDVVRHGSVALTAAQRVQYMVEVCERRLAELARAGALDSAQLAEVRAEVAAVKGKAETAGAYRGGEELLRFVTAPGDTRRAPRPTRLELGDGPREGAPAARGASEDRPAPPRGERAATEDAHALQRLSLSLPFGMSGLGSSSAMISPAPVDAVEHAPQAPAPGASGPALEGLTRALAAPTGTTIAVIGMDRSQLPVALRPAEDAAAEVTAALLVDGDRLVVHVQIGPEHWVASLSATDAAEALVGREALQQLGSATELVHGLARRVRRTGTRLRIHLWGDQANESFVVIDLARVVRGVGADTLAGLRPVEAQILLTDKERHAVGGVRLFGGQDVTQASALPSDPIGGWFPLPNVPELRAALGGSPDTEHGEALVGAAFYDRGVLRVAVKESEAATTGLVAHLDLAWLGNKLAAFGEKVLDWVKSLLERIKSGAIDLFRALSPGSFRLALPGFPGVWFDFDFRVALPRLFKGRGFGFDLSGLWPTGFQLDFGFGGLSLGAMPKLSFPWLRGPKVGGFDVSWDRFKGLLPSLPGLPALPSLSLPRIPRIGFGLHRISGLRFGLGADLSLAWPELGDLSLGFTLDLAKLLDAIAGAGRWLLNKLRAAGDFLQRWIHLGDDGVLRIYDAQRPDGPMLGFHLLRLLDGAQETDLAPTELRWTEGDAGVAMELGEAEDRAKRGAEKSVAERGKGTPDRPGGILLASRNGIAAPASLARVLALAPGAAIDVSLHVEGERIVVFSEAPSTLYDHGQALRTSLNLRVLAQRVIAKWPAGKGAPPPLAAFEIEKNPERTQRGPRLNFRLPSALGVEGSQGYAVWKLEDLLRAEDWTDLAPSELQLPIDGVGGLALGELSFAEVGPVRGPRFDVQSRPLAQKLLRDTDDTVWAGVHWNGDLVGVSLTKEADGTEGALAHVRLSFLLAQLKKLGDLGRRALEGIADLALPTWRAGGGDKSDVFAHLVAIAERIARSFLRFVDGLLTIELGNGKFIGWDLRAQLPRLGLDLDLGALIPRFELDLPKLPSFSIAFRPRADFGSSLGFRFRLPDFGLRGLLDGVPNLALPKGFHVDVSRLGDLLGLSIQLGDLFGTGQELSFGFRVPLGNLLASARKLLDGITDNVGAAFELLHVGDDGVLRIFDRTRPDHRVGFDLKKLFDGVQAEDLVPVEATGTIASKAGAPLAQISYGDAYVSKDDERDAKIGVDRGTDGDKAGKVLVRRPQGQAVVNHTVTAPAWLAAHLGAPPDARIHASLYFDKARAQLFAVVAGSDRGVLISLEIDALSRSLPSIDAGGLRIDPVGSMRGGMLVLGIGTEQVSGRAGWKLAKLLEAPSLESLLPDELVLEKKDVGKLTVASEIDVSKLTYQQTIALPRWGFLQERLGDRPGVAVFANDFSKGNPTVALVDPEDKDDRRAGVQLRLERKFTEGLNKKLRELAHRTRATVGRALNKTANAGQLSTIGLAIHPSPGGLRVERGQAGAPDHMYATWSWHHLGRLVEGELDGLEPDSFRLATKALALEVTDLEPGDEQLPERARQIRELHPLLRDTLTAFGLSPQEYVDLQLDSPDTRVTDPERKMLAAVGHVYDVDDRHEVTGGKQIRVEVGLEALLAQVLPHRRRWGEKDERPARRTEGTHVTGGVEVGAEGVEMSVGVRRIRKGKETEFELTAGWTFQQVLDLLMHLDQVVSEDGSPNRDGAVGLLTPSTITGRFTTETWAMEFGNDGQRSEYHCLAGHVPGLPWALGTVLDPATIAATTLHLNLPSEENLKAALDQARDGRFVPLAGCSLEVPRRDPLHLDQPPAAKLYGITLHVSPAILRRLLQLIPGAGIYLKLAETIWNFAKDPKGALESLRYTPEALVMVVEAAPEIIGAIKDDWKGIAMKLVLGGDMSTKQAVMAGRIRKKLDAAGWKRGDTPPGDLAAYDPAYLEWVASQPADQLAQMAELADSLRGVGLEHDPALARIPANGKLPTREEIEAKIEEVAAGYQEFADLQRAAHADDRTQEPSVSQAELEQAARELRRRVSKVIRAGGTAAASLDPGGMKTTDQAPTHGSDRDYADVTDLEPSSEEDDAMARGVFESEENEREDGERATQVIVTVAESQWLIRAYGGLSLEQLGELLTTGSTLVQTTAGERKPLPLHEDDRGFVRELFVRKARARGFTVGSGGAGASSDSELVAAYHAFASRTERGAAGGGTGGGREDAGLGSLDDAFEDADLGGGDGAGRGTGEGPRAGDGAGPHEEGTNGRTGASAPQGVGDLGQARRVQPDGTSARDQELPPRSLHEFFFQSPATAQSFVRFDPERGTASINEDMALIARKLPPFIDDLGREVSVVDVRLAAYNSSGTLDAQVYQYTLEIVVHGKEATGGLNTSLFYTYTYVPAEGSSRAFGTINGQELAAKLNAAVRIQDDQGFVVPENETFEFEGMTLTVMEVVKVAVDETSKDQVLADLSIKFDKLPGPSTVVREANGRLTVVRQDDSAILRVPLRCD